MRYMAWVLLLGSCIPMLEREEYQGEGEAPDLDWEAPENSWPMASPPADLVGEGLSEGQVAPDFLLRDQHGDDVSLWQFYGSVVALDVSAMWCAPCQELAEDVEPTWQDYKDDGFVYVTLLAENVTGNEPTDDDLNDWANTFDITAPVVADPGYGYSGPAVPDGVLPVLLVLDRELRVVERVEPATDANLRAAIEAAL